MDCDWFDEVVITIWGGGEITEAVAPNGGEAADHDAV